MIKNKSNRLIRLSKLSPGFKQFLVKTVVFVALFIFIQIFVIPLQKIELPSQFYLILDTDLGKALLVTIVLFVILTKDKMTNLKKYEFGLKSTTIFSLLALVSLISYFYFKIFVSQNIDFVLRYIPLFFPLKYVFFILILTFLALAVFGIKFSKDFFKKFKKEILIIIGFFFLILFLIIQFQKLWPFFSLIVAKTVHYLLSLTSQTTLSFNNKIPIIGINNFIVGIDKPCSGIDSIFMFTFLYISTVGFDWKILNKKKAILMFFPGVIGAFLLNILRICLLILFGAYVSKEFALGAFHTSASMIFFLIYFAVFWFLFYKWMKKPEFRKENKPGIIKTFYNKIMSDSLYRNSLYLMISTLVVSFFGFIFWMINARLFTTEQVGLATTIISSASLITSISALGLGAGLIRYLPKSERKNDKINTCFTLVALVSIIASTIFLLIIDFTSPKLHFIKENMILAFIFIIFMIFASSNLLIDSVFLAYRNTKYVLIKNSVFSIFKIILPFLLVSLGAYGIFSSYMLALIAGFATVFIILIYKFNYNPKFIFYDSIIRKIGKYSFGNYVAGFIGGLPILLLPLLILNNLGAEVSAYYYMAMMIANALFIIPNATSNSLFAEGSYDEKQLKHQIKKATKIILLLLIPAIIITIFFGKYILLLLGKDYSSEGFMFLNLIAISGIFVGINAIIASIIKVRKKISALITRSILSSILILGLSVFLIKQNYGLLGIGYAYLIGQIITAVMFVWVVWRK